MISSISSRAVKDGVFIACVYSAVLLVTALFVWLVGDVVIKGWGALDLNFLLSEVESAGRAGGIAPLIVSTVWVLLICLVTVLPLGVATALFLSEFATQRRHLKQFFKLSLDLLAGVPSIVFGLFGNLFFCQILGLGFSILSGGLTLACMSLPLFVRTAQESLSAVPLKQRLNGYALGFNETSLIFKIVIPQSLPGLAAALVLSIGRSLAETAALIFTSGYVDRYPRSAFDSGRTLSIHIYDLSMNVVGGDHAAYKTAFVLMMLIVVINLVVAVLFRLLSKSVGVKG